MSDSAKSNKSLIDEIRKQFEAQNDDLKSDVREIKTNMKDRDQKQKTRDDKIFNEIESIKTLLVGDIDKPEKPGMLEVMRNLSSEFKASKVGRIAWTPIIVASITAISGVAALVWKLS